MSFTKFFDLLQSKEIHLTRLDKFSNDPWEGKVPPNHYDPERLISVSHQVVSDGGTISLNNPNSTLMKQIDIFGDKWDNYVKSSKEAEERTRKTFFVNCWHINDYESEAAWNLYTKSDCVAISTTVQSLTTSISNTYDLYLASIQYYDPTKETIPSGNSFFAPTHKRRQYEHEKEVRIMHHCTHSLQWWKNEAMEFHRISVDTNLLIKEIWISPFSDDLLEKSVKHLANSHGLNAKIIKSTILTPP